LHVPGKPLVLFNIWDAGSARAVALAGGKAIATGSWSVANANGFADGERMPLALAIDNLRRIVGVTDLPVTVDLESGYGDAANVVGETVGLAIDAGAVGCNLEDSFPANGTLRETVDQADDGIGFGAQVVTVGVLAAIALRIGLRYVSGLSEDTARCITAERDRAPFSSLGDLVHRSALRADARVRLARAGACSAFGEFRRDLL